MPHSATHEPDASHIISLKDEAATLSLAGCIAAMVRPGDTLLLHGGLGAGKTSFARGLIRVLAGDENLPVPSPTFTIVQTYATPQGELWHMDCYRLEAEGDAEETGIGEALGHATCLVEWPEAIGYLLPEDRLDLYFRTPSDGQGREVTLAPSGNWAGRLGQWKG